jgi:hypothetical protein
MINTFILFTTTGISVPEQDRQPPQRDGNR